MTAAAISFDFEGHEVRSVTKDADPWFVAKDICDALELTNSHKTLARLDEDEKGVGIIDTLGGDQVVNLINEPGVYRLVFTSRAKKAEKFKRWLAHEVLPELRRSGEYQLGAPSGDNVVPFPPAKALLTSEVRGLPEDHGMLLAYIRECRMLFGRQAAQQFWMDSGLPCSFIEKSVIQSKFAIWFYQNFERVPGWRMALSSIRDTWNTSEHAAATTRDIGGYLREHGFGGEMAAMRPFAADEQERRRLTGNPVTCLENWRTKADMIEDG